MALAIPGDILLSYESQRPTSLFIRGFYDHAVMVAEFNGTKVVVEAVGDIYRRVSKRNRWDIIPFLRPYICNEDGSRKNYGGVRRMELEEWLFKKDHVAIVRIDAPADIVRLAWMYVLTLVGLGYDYFFSFDNEKVYCSETPYVAFRKYIAWFLAELPSNKEILPQQYWDLAETIPYIRRIADTRTMEKDAA